MSRTWFWLAGPVLASAWLLSTETASAYRPFTGTDADVADTGEFELELGPLNYAQEGASKLLLAPAVVLNLGILPRTELIVDLVNVVPLHPDGGPHIAVVDTGVAAKVLLHRGALQAESGPGVAVEGGLLLPEIHGDDGFGAALNLVVSEQWGWCVLHLNNEASLSRGDLRFGWSTSLIGEAQFGGPLRPVAELVWEREFSSGASRYSVLGGAIWNAAQGLDLDAAVVVGSVEDEAAFEARLGLTWAVEVWEPAPSE